MKRRLVLWFGNSLIATGALLLLVTFGLLAYSQIEQDQFSQEAAAMTPPPTLTAVPKVIATTAPSATAPSATAPAIYAGSGLEGVSRTAMSSTSTATATPVPPSPTPMPILPAQRISAPTIGLDTKIVESRIVNGEWQVPKFVAGHLEGTAQPLQNGNIVLSGHVESISSGNVFAKIGHLKVGDPLRLYTQASAIDYVVSAIVVVANTDMSVVQPTNQEQLTLITCTGTFLPLQRDYNKRTVVIANRQS